MFDVVMVLSAAGREETLRETLHALSYTGGADGLENVEAVVVYVGEGESPALPCGWKLHRIVRAPSGSTLDMMAALDWCAHFYGDGLRRLLYFEDDVWPVTNAVPWMLGMDLPPWAAFVSCFDGTGRLGSLPLIAEIDSTTNLHDGNQALVIPGVTLRHVVGQSLPQGTNRNLADVVFAKLATSRGNGLSWGLVSPSLVQHVGVRSLANPGRSLDGRGRTAENFPGVDWDACGPGLQWQVGRLVTT